MKRIRIAVLAFMSAALIAVADVNDLPVKNIDGRSYHYYEVQPKETLYSICRRLNITKEKLVESNPQVATDGLKANSILLFPVPTKDRLTDTHLVKKGETIYGICHAYGITPAQLEAWNPNVRDGLKAGMTVYVAEPAHAVQKTTDLSQVAKSIKNAVQEQDKTVRHTDGFISYTVRDKETFYSIAHSHGVSVATLEEANPGIGILKSGQILKIPVGTSEKDVAGANTSITEPVKETSVPGSDKETIGVEEIITETKRGIDIAIILPFKAGTTPQPRQSQLYTEFYKGFLLAVDSMRSCGTPINIYAYDTDGSADSLRSILRKPELKNVRLIIPPDAETQLDEIVAFGEQNNVSVLNLFAIRDGSYMTHSNVFQANIPHQAMYDKAVDGIVKDLHDRIPVILNPTDSSPDKMEFVKLLKRKLDGRGIQYKQIDYATALSIDDISDLDRSVSYAFIPSTGKQSDLNRMLPALIEFKSGMTGFDPVRLYGYPEWTTFRGETLENMHAMNTYVYSRFFTVPDDPWASEVQQTFEKWYGVPMGNYVPRQGLLGFDTAMYLIGALKDTTPVTTYNGVQNGFHFVRPAGVAGFVNDDLYFVNFRPSGLIDRIEL